MISVARSCSFIRFTGSRKKNSFGGNERGAKIAGTLDSVNSLFPIYGGYKRYSQRAPLSTYVPLHTVIPQSTVAELFERILQVSANIFFFQCRRAMTAGRRCERPGCIISFFLFFLTFS